MQSKIEEKTRSSFLCFFSVFGSLIFCLQMTLILRLPTFNIFEQTILYCLPMSNKDAVPIERGIEACLLCVYEAELTCHWARETDFQQDSHLMTALSRPANRLTDCFATTGTDAHGTHACTARLAPMLGLMTVVDALSITQSRGLSDDHSLYFRLIRYRRTAAAAAAVIVFDTNARLISIVFETFGFPHIPPLTLQINHNATPVQYPINLCLYLPLSYWQSCSVWDIFGVSCPRSPSLSFIFNHNNIGLRPCSSSAGLCLYRFLCRSRYSAEHLHDNPRPEHL